MLKQNLYKEFLYAIQMKGIKLAKDFRQHGIPYAQHLDNYAKEVENNIISDQYVFRKGREDSPKRGGDPYDSVGRKSDSDRGNFKGPYGNNSVGSDDDQYNGPWSKYAFDPRLPEYGRDGLPYNPRYNPKLPDYDSRDGNPYGANRSRSPQRSGRVGSP